MTTIQHDPELLHQLGWRYATKRFIVGRPIPADHWVTLEQALQLSPSSYGLQPYRFVVVRDRALRQQIHEAARKQPQILEAAELVIFAARTDLTSAQVDHFIAQTAAVRQIPFEALEKYRTSILGDLVTGKRHAIIADWSKRQAYLALGMLLSTAAQLGIDACPMEGFVPEEVDRILGLPALGFGSAVFCALGYRSPQDPHQNDPKVRMPHDELFDYR